MKAAMVSDVGKVEIKELDYPTIKEDDVLIKVKTAGVCGSDLHLFRGTHAFRKPPAILGHEVAGEVVEVGKNVKHVSIGDRVTVEPHIGCGVCEFCMNNQVNLCLNKVAPGTPNWIGTFVEYFPAPEKTVYKLAPSVTYEIGTMIEPLAVAVHAMNKITTSTKDSIVILGAGTIGLLLTVVAKEMGYKKIICTDTALFNRESAINLGAIAAFDPINEDIVTEVKKLTAGRGADVVMVAAGANNIIDQASACCKRGGEIGIVSMITEKIPVYTYNMVFNEQRVFGAMTYETKDFVQAVDMVNNGLNLNYFITQILDLDNTQTALSILSEKKENVIKVLVKVS